MQVQIVHYPSLKWNIQFYFGFFIDYTIVLLMPQLKKSVSQWIASAKQRGRYIFFYEEKVLDLTQFISIHPGGEKALTNYLYKDITDIVFSVFPHKKEQTGNTLLKYVVGVIPQNSTNKRLRSQKSITKIEGSNGKQKKKVCFVKKQSQNDANLNQKKPEVANKPHKKMSQDPKKSTKTSEQSKKEGKSKHKHLTVSIKIIEDEVTDDSNKTLAQDKGEKSKKSQDTTFSDAILNDQMQEQKPIFLVPVLMVRHMTEL